MPVGSGPAIRFPCGLLLDRVNARRCNTSACCQECILVYRNGRNSNDVSGTGLDSPSPRSFCEWSMLPKNRNFVSAFFLVVLYVIVVYWAPRVRRRLFPMKPGRGRRRQPGGRKNSPPPECANEGRGRQFHPALRHLPRAHGRASVRARCGENAIVRFGPARLRRRYLSCIFSAGGELKRDSSRCRASRS